MFIYKYAATFRIVSRIPYMQVNFIPYRSVPLTGFHTVPNSVPLTELRTVPFRTELLTINRTPYGHPYH